MNYRAKEFLLVTYSVIIQGWAVVGLSQSFNLDVVSTFLFAFALFSASTSLAIHFLSPKYQLDKLDQKFLTNWYFIKKYSDGNSEKLKTSYLAENEKIKVLVNALLQYHSSDTEEDNDYVTEHKH